MMLVIDCPELNASIRRQAEKMKEVSRQIAPDGAITDGKGYMSVEQDIGKKVYYGIWEMVLVDNKIFRSC